MSPLQQYREEIAQSLGDLPLNTYTHIPGAVALPAAFIAAGSPYIEEGRTIAEWCLRHEVVLCTMPGDNLSETTALDDQISDVVAALLAEDFLVESVSQPFIQEFGNAPALCCIVTVMSFGTITKE